MNQHYQTIDSFFDSFDLTSSIKLLRKTIKTADTEKLWKGIPANALYFTSLLEDLVTAVFELLQQYDYKDEIIIKEDKIPATLTLTAFETYCGWHTGKTAWDFFPRHLSKKEFLNPYLALEKFTKQHSLSEWKYLLNDILNHALSIESISQFYDGQSILNTWLYLHKLLEATHLIEVRQSTPQSKPRRKWKPPVETNNQYGEATHD